LRKPAKLRLCRFLRPFSRWHGAFKTRESRRCRRYRAYVHYGFDSEYARSSRHCVAFDSLYWMRHPHPLISLRLLSLMLLCSIRATSHEQPLETISLSAPEDCHRCGLLQLACAHRLFP
jgi:hypothetical protein